MNTNRNVNAWFRIKYRFVNKVSVCRQLNTDALPNYEAIECDSDPVFSVPDIFVPILMDTVCTNLVSVILAS